MKKLWLPILLAAFACESNSEDPFEPEIVAKANLYALSQQNETDYEVLGDEIGEVEFAQEGDVVQIRVSLKGMTPNTYKAVHIHDGTLEVPGRHWNQGSYQAACSIKSLGSDWGKPFIGDVGNVPIGSNGEGEFVLRTDLWRINSGDEKDVLNTIIIIHDDPEDFAEECDPNHSHDYVHSNKKIGGGDIVLVSDVPLNEQSIATPEQVPDFLICR